MMLPWRGGAKSIKMATGRISQLDSWLYNVTRQFLWLPIMIIMQESSSDCPHKINTKDHHISAGNHMPTAVANQVFRTLCIAKVGRQYVALPMPPAPS